MAIREFEPRELGRVTVGKRLGRVMELGRVKCIPTDPDADYAGSIKVVSQKEVSIRWSFEDGSGVITAVVGNDINRDPNIKGLVHYISDR